MGTFSPGNAHCQRIIIASVPPKARNTRPVQRNCLAMTLWSVEKRYFPQNVVGRGGRGSSPRTWVARGGRAARARRWRYPCRPLVLLEVPLPAPVRRAVVGVVRPLAVDRGLVQPPLEIVLGEDGEQALHLVVVGAA